jgi:hypothetical protein
MITLFSRLFTRAASMADVPILSCAADPMDLRPALDGLEAMIRERARRGPVVVLLGEDHRMPTHVALPQALMTRLMGGASPLSLACGMEYPHNFLENILEQGYGHAIPPALRGQIAAADGDGQKLARAFRAKVTPDFAPVTYRNLVKFCRVSGISLRFNDAALNNGYLDHRDEVTRAMLPTQAQKNGDDKIENAKSLGVAIRNRIIAAHIITHLRDTGAEVYIQSCGADHLFGDRRSGIEKLEYNDSLSALFTAAAIDAFAVLPTGPYSKLDTIPFKAGAALKAGAVIDGLSPRKFFDDDTGEAAFLAEISRRSGDALTIYSDPGVNRDPALFKDSHAWIAEAALAAPVMAMA